MTEERNQGLYECEVYFYVMQMIKRAKALLNRRNYLNLEFIVNGERVEEKDENDEPILKQQIKPNENGKKIPVREIDVLKRGFYKVQVAVYII